MVTGTATVKQRNTAHLEPYKFKPGQSGNPKGRPKEKLSKHERLVILSEIAKHQIESAVSAGHKIAAIREANLMEGVYQEALSGYNDNRTTNIIVLDGSTKELIGKIHERTGKLIEGSVQPKSGDSNATE